ncbi:MAG: glycoside hydrolase, partial [Fibrobacter sp.]|nr:glycoside hydrolase [Fibrobacter sp.]
QLFMDDEAITDTLALTGTGDFDTYGTFKGTTTKELTEGEHVLKVLVTSDYVNLDWIAFGESEDSAEDIRNGTTGIVPKIAAGAVAAFASVAGTYRVFDLMGSELGTIRLDAGATLTDLKAGLKAVGFNRGVYVIRNASRQTFRVDLGR